MNPSHRAVEGFWPNVVFISQYIIQEVAHGRREGPSGPRKAIG